MAYKDKEKQKKWVAENQEHLKEYHLRYRQRTRKVKHEHYLKNRDKYIVSSKEWNLKNKDRKSRTSSLLNKKIKYEVFKIIGGKKNPECNMCGFSDMRALTIDHILNNGKTERKFTGLGSRFYKWLIKNNFPNKETYQILCMNCQFIRKHKLHE